MSSTDDSAEASQLQPGADNAAHKLNAQEPLLDSVQSTQPSGAEEQQEEQGPARLAIAGAHDAARRTHRLRQNLMGFGRSRPTLRRRGMRALWPLWFSLALTSGLTIDRAQAAADSDAARVYWRGQSFAAGDWPPTMHDDQRALVEDWAGWAGAMNYRMDLDSSGRVMLLSSKKNSTAHREMKLVQETLERFDQWLTPPEAAEFSVMAEVMPTPRGSGDAVVLLRLANRGDYLSCLETLAEDHNYLRDWSQDAGAGNGFALEQPTCAAWLESDRGDEDWQAKNELVSGLTLGLLRSSFGRQPHWFEQGVRWQMEDKVLGSIWCFPGRTSFVSRGEHSGWSRELRTEFKKGRSEPVDMGLMSDWQRGTWNDQSAAASWGMVGYLIEHERASLPLIATALGAHWDDSARETHSDGSWARIPSYEIPEEAQQSILQQYSLCDPIPEATEFFRKGHSYKAP
ncbi:MAG: hypothetical protein ACI841_004145 [Planctomycetota bacterium]|jgi:hypothetical protein